MKRLRFIPALLLILSACSEQIIGPGKDSGAEGSILLDLTARQRTEAVQTKAELELELPDVDDFRVAVYKNANKMRLYNDSYANVKNEPYGIKLNAGEYYVVAQHGDTLGCGFNKPYFMASSIVSVNGYNTPVALEAKLANVGLSVKYDETITGIYSDYYAVVKHNTHSGKSVRFERGEVRDGFIPAGDLVFQIYVWDDSEGNGMWKYYETDPITYRPNDFVTFYVALKDAMGGVTINIKVDNTVEDKEIDVDIPAYVTPQAAPSIELSGFDGEGSTADFTEGVAASGGSMAHFVARGGIASCVLSINSEYLQAKGIPSEVDFANLTPELENSLIAMGFEWTPELLTSRLTSYIDFSGLIEKMLEDIKATGQDVKVADFTLKVTDAVNKSAEVSFGIKSLGIQTSVNVNSYDVWAKRICNPAASTNRGNMSLLKIQTSTDNVNWTNVTGSPSQNGLSNVYEYIPVNAGTKYYIRSIYNGNEACKSETVEVTTENAQQIVNGGFEDWTEGQVQSYALSGSSKQYTYYPWANESDKWWDTNNSATTKASGTPGYLEKKCFPMVSFMQGRTGGKAAQIMAIAVNGGNTNGTSLSDAVPGEIFIGTYGGENNHSFSSRPDKMSFWFKYDIRTDDSYSDDTFRAYIVLYNGSEQIGSGILDYKTASDITSWTQATVDIDYTVKNKPATAIYVQFLQSIRTKPVYNMNVSITYGNNRTASVHGGSILTVDDVELIYE